MSKKIIKMDFNTINQKLIDNEFNSSFEFEESIISIEDLKEEEEKISERLKQISKSISIILKKIIEINSKKK